MEKLKRIEEVKLYADLEALVLPIVDFLKEKGYAYPTVVITPEKVKLTTDEISIPIPYSEIKHDDTDDVLGT